MKTKHTPGPWKVEVVRDSQQFRAVEAGEFAIVSETNQLCPATVWGMTINDGEGEANARLIAAAPELLAALREMVETYKSLPELRWKYRNSCSDELLAMEFQAIPQAEAAIAKAEEENENH